MLGVPDLVGRQRQVRELELVIEALRGGRGDLVVHDLHWADSPSVQLLGFLAPQLHTAPLVIVATTRDGTDSEPLQSALLGGLVRYGRRLIVPALTADEFPEYAAQLTDSPPNQ